MFKIGQNFVLNIGRLSRIFVSVTVSGWNETGEYAQTLSHNG